MVEKKGLIYLYCIIKTKPLFNSFEEIGIKLHPIYFQGLYAIVSEVSTDEFDEENLKKNLSNMEWVEKKVRLHEKIIEEIMKNSTVLPFKFATIFESEDNVKKLLKERNQQLKQILVNLDGNEERGLKIYCDLEKLKESLIKEDARIQGIEREIASSGKGKTFLLEKKRNELIKNIINEKISEYTQDSFARLKKISLEAKINKLLPKQVTEREDEMVFNAAFLIDKNRLKEFENIVEYLKTKYTDKGLIFDSTGPWPPYNFCSLLEG